MKRPTILRAMDCEKVRCGKRIGGTFAGRKLDQRSFRREFGGESASSFEKIIHVEMRISTHRKGETAGRVDGEVVDASLMAFHGLEVQPRIGVPDADGSIFGAAEQIVGVRELGAIEAESSDGTGVMEEGAHVHVCVGGEVEDVNGIVSSASGQHRPESGHAFDGAKVRRVREGGLEMELLETPSPQEALVGSRHQLHDTTLSNHDDDDDAAV